MPISIRQAGLDREEAYRILARAWETAVEGTLEDGLLSLDEGTPWPSTLITSP